MMITDNITNYSNSVYFLYCFWLIIDSHTAGGQRQKMVTDLRNQTQPISYLRVALWGGVSEKKGALMPYT
jgi:hypothetical protein